MKILAINSSKLLKNLRNLFSYKRLSETASGLLKSGVLKEKIRFDYGAPLFILFSIMDRINANLNNQLISLMTDEQIFERIREIISLFINVNENSITLNSSFHEDLDADSLDIIELTLRFEEAFKIDMAEEDSLKLRTVRDMCAYVKSKIDAKKT
jgi:acyl carrier protein